MALPARRGAQIWRGLGAAAMAVCLSATAVHSQQTPRDTAVRRDSVPANVQPMVVTGGRTPAVAGGTSTLEVRLDSLRVAPLPTLEQALRALPFVLVRQNSRGEAELSLRGSETRQAAVLVDGLPLTLGWDHRTDPSLIPLGGARRLSLTRGLATVLAGPNTLGGLIEVDVAGGTAGGGPAAAARRLTTGVDQTGAGVFGGQGSVTREAAGGLAELRGGGGWRSRNGVAKSDAVAGSAARDLRTNSDLRLADGFLAGRWTAPGGASAGLTLIGYDAERGVPPELHLEEPRWWRYPLVRRGLAVLSGSSGLLTTPFGSGTIAASAGISGGRSVVEQYGDPDYRIVQGTERGTEATRSARVAAEHSAGSFATVRASVTGADVRYREQIDRDPAMEYWQRLWSAGAEASVRIPPLAGTDLTAGLVWDGADTPRSGRKPPIGQIGAWGGRVGLTSALSDAVRVHSAVSRRVRTPSLRELYSGALGRFEPNPGLQPEQLLGAEAGLTVVAGPYVLQGTAFQTRLTDAVVRVLTPEGQFRRENRDRMTNTGLELLGSWTGAHGVSVLSDLLVQRTRIVDQNDGVQRRAEHQPGIRASVEVITPLPVASRGSLRVAVTGAQWCLHPELAREQRLAPWTRTDATLERSWRVGAPSAVFSRIRTVLALDNIADAAAFDQCGLPQPGRTLRLAFEIS